MPISLRSNAWFPAERQQVHTQSRQRIQRLGWSEESPAFLNRLARLGDGRLEVREHHVAGQKPLNPGTAAGLVARRSDRSIDWPVRTMVIGVDWADMTMVSAESAAEARTRRMFTAQQYGNIYHGTSPRRAA